MLDTPGPTSFFQSFQLYRAAFIGGWNLLSCHEDEDEDGSVLHF